MNRYCLLAFAFLVAIYAYSAPMRAQEQKAKTTSSGTPVTQVPGTLPVLVKDSTPAVVTTTVPSPASPAHYPEQLMWAAAMSYLIEWLKKQTWFPLSKATPANLQATFAFVVALVTAAGIHIAVSGSLLSDGGLSFSVTGLTADAIKDIGFQWVSQQGWYDALIKAKA